MESIKNGYKKWVIWIVAIVLGAWAALFVFDLYDSWRINAPYRAQDQVLQDSLNAWEREGKRITNLYKNDTYGGDTPEETLELFIQALEDEDYELASKYYLPEQQKDVLEELASIDEFGFYLTILLTYEKKGSLFPNEKVYEIEFFENGVQKHLERFNLNEYTNVWKLENF